MDRLPELRTGSPGLRRGHLRPIPELEIPYGIVEGAAPGPCLLVTAGVHASECCSIEAAVRLVRTDPAGLRGTLVVLPILSVFGATLATVEAEVGGIVLYRLTTLAVNAGEALIGIGTPRA